MGRFKCSRFPADSPATPTLDSSPLKRETYPPLYLAAGLWTTPGTEHNSPPRVGLQIHFGARVDRFCMRGVRLAYNLSCDDNLALHKLS